MSSQRRDLGQVKAAAKAQFGTVEGVVGFGIGEESIRIYINDDAVRAQLPASFQGVSIDLIRVGEVVAL